MATGYIPYEALSTAESEDMMVTVRKQPSFKNLDPQQLAVLGGLLAGMYARGLDMGFALSETEPDSPATLMEVYNAGVAEGSKLI